jgi:hypothetical protein
MTKIQDFAGLPEEELLWTPQRQDAINDCWSAARSCIDLLQTQFDLPLHFPTSVVCWGQ